MAAAVGWVAGCDSTLFVQPGQHILRTDPSFEGNRNVSDGDLAGAIRSKPNGGVLGAKYGVYLYNLGGLIAIDSSPTKRWLHRKFDRDTLIENGIVNWFQEEVGEAPVIVENLPLARDAQNLESLYFSRGFLDAYVRPEVVPHRNRFKADVRFQIDEGPGYHLRNIRRQSTDTTLLRLLAPYDDESLLQQGERYNQDNIANERVRLSNILRDSGYFRMGPELISYIADTTINPNLRGLYRALIDTLQPGDSLPPPMEERRLIQNKHMDLTVVLPDTAHQFTLREVYIRVRRTDDPVTADALGFDLQRLSPTVKRSFRIAPRWLRPEHDFTVITLPEIAREIRLSALARRVSQFPGQLYSQALQRRTVQQLNNLGLFRSVGVNYLIADSLSHELDTYIDLVMLRKYDLRTGIEGFSTNDPTLQSNFPGAGASVSLTNRNLLGRAERLDLQLGGNISWYRSTLGGTQALFQFTGRANLTIPAFLFIENPRRNLLRFRPNTSFSLTALLENRREFNRASYNLDWTYTWFSTPYSTKGQFQVTPLALTYVRTQRNPELQEFFNSIGENQAGLIFFIDRDLTSRFLSRHAFSYTYSDDYGVNRNRSTWFIRPSFEIGGTIPWLVDKLGPSETNDITVTIAGSDLQYGQYVRGAIDVRLHTPIGLESALVSRVFAGYAHGVGGSPFVPFEARFYTGGVSSVRGWLSNALGPGSIPQVGGGVNNVVAIGGEVGLEANVEYRFPLFSLLKGALFTDAGNVWLNRQNQSPDSRGKLSTNNFEVGLAAGLGIRLDVSLLVFRLDLGQQLYAPDLRGWVVKRWPADIGSNRLQWNFGVGYPF